MDVFDDVDDQWSYWKTLFLDVIGKHAPIVKIRCRKHSDPWLTNETKQLMQSRNYYQNKFRKKRDPADWDHYLRLRNLVKKKINADKSIYFAAVCNEHHKQPKKLWKELNVALGHKVKRKVALVDITPGYMQSPVSLANRLNCHFSSTAASPSSHSVHNVDCPKMDPVSSKFHFQPLVEEDVHSALQGLDVRKATGPDGITAHLLKSTASVIAPSITKLFNNCITSGETPYEWKEANITPIGKSSSGNMPSDYRPISVLSVIAKVYESLIHGQLYSYLSTNSLLHPSQSGFRPSHNTQDVLLTSNSSSKTRGAAAPRTRITCAYFLGSEEPSLKL